MPTNLKTNDRKKTPQDWQEEIVYGLEYRRIFGFEEAWADLERIYVNDPNSSAAIGPNLVFSMGDTLLSSLIVPDPEVLVTPLNATSAQSAPIVEAQDNLFIKTLRLKDEVETCLLHDYLYGTHILKVGYDSEFGWAPESDLGGPTDPAGMTLTQFNKKGDRIESGIARPGYPWVRAVSPHDIVVPWGTKDLDSAEWIAHRIIRKNKAIKKDPKYKNTQRLQPQITMQDFVESYQSSALKGNRRHITHALDGFDPNRKTVFNELWEIHEKTTGRVFVIAFDYDKYLRNQVDALQTAGLPFVAGNFIRNPRTFWGTPQAFYLAQTQETMFDVSLQMEKQRRISILRFIARKDAFDDDELNKLISGDVGAVAKSKTNGPLKESIVLAPQGNNFDLLVQQDAVRRDAQDAVGFSRNQVGEFDRSTRRTAKEVGAVEQGAQTRQSRRVDVMTALYVDTLKKINALIQRFWFLPQQVKVNDKWIFFTGDDLKGEFQYDISLSTKRHQSSDGRTLEALQLLANLAQYPGANLPGIEKHVAEISNNPQFADFFLSTSQKTGQTSAPSSTNAQQQVSLGPGSSLGGQ